MLKEKTFIELYDRDDHGESDEDDPYEYDDDIRPSNATGIHEDDYEDEELLQLEAAAVAEAALNTLDANKPTSSARAAAPCWGCVHCKHEATSPLFLVASPAEAPCNCSTCQ